MKQLWDIGNDDVPPQEDTLEKTSTDEPEEINDDDDDDDDNDDGDDDGENISHQIQEEEVGSFIFYH